MAVTNFIPQVWSKDILDALETECKLVANCHLAYEGDVKYAGSVKILGVGEPTVGDYTGADISIEDMKDEGQILNIDQRKYFAFYVDDVDEAQSVPGLRQEYQRKSVHALAVTRDTFVAGLIKTGTHVTTATALTTEDIKEAVDEAIIAAQERNFNEPGVIELDPRSARLFKNQLITMSTDNPAYIKRGVIGTYDGFEVVVSNNLAKDTNHTYCCLRGKKAIAFAGQLKEVKAVEAEKRFADIVKGLDVYGGKVIDNDRIQVIKVPRKAA